MPIVLRIKGYRFGFWASDNDEPRHVHVRKNGKSAKYWLEPAVLLQSNHGFRPHELNDMERMILEHRDELMEAWNVFFNH